MNIGKSVYFVPSLSEKPIKGTITKILSTGCNFYEITIRTKSGEEYTGTSNQFSAKYPAILSYWR